MAEQFENAKVGDKVIFHYDGWSDYRELATITKVGRFINVDRGGKTNYRKSGASVGYRSGSIKPFSDEEWNAYLATKLDKKKLTECIQFNWNRADIEIIRKVHAILYPTGKL